MNKQHSIFSLSGEEFEELQQTGFLYKLYPDAPINLQEFLSLKQESELNEAAFNLFMAITNYSGVDVEELIILFQQYKEEIKLYIENMDDIDINLLIESVREVQ